MRALRSFSDEAELSAIGANPNARLLTMVTIVLTMVMGLLMLVVFSRMYAWLLAPFAAL